MTDSTILIKSPDGWKFKAAVGIGGLAVVVILAFLYRIEVGLIVLTIGSAIGARVWVWAIHQYKLAEFERRRVEAEVAKAEAEAVQAKTRAYFVEVNAGTFVLDGIVIASFYPAVTASRLLADAPVLLPHPEPSVKRLLDIDFIHMLIRGPSGSGKTTIGNWLIDNARPGAAIYVLDPHATQNARLGLPWSPRAEVVGDGRDWQAIDSKLQSLMAEMSQRYMPGAGPVFQEILIVSDEWLAVLEHCPSARLFFETIGGEARKVQMHLVIMTVAATVDDLKCSRAVVDNLVELRLDFGLKARNRGELRWGRGNIETVELPGKYRAAFAPVVRLPEPVEVPEPIDPLPILDAGPVAPLPTADELRICELWDGGASLRAIWKEVYGTEFGGRQAEEIKKVLKRFGRV